MGLLVHLKVIACEVAAREIFYCAARARNTVEIELFTQGLHDNADACRAELQKRIDTASPSQFQAVLLGYGLCNNAIVGIRAGQVKMAIPRAHDCITLFLGSAERYAEEFAGHPGTYYYTSGWLEYQQRGGQRVEYAQKSGLAKRMAYEELVRKYGAENAEYIRQVMDGWQVKYTRGALVRFPFTDHLRLDASVREICAKNNWQYAELDGDPKLLQDLLDGNWQDEKFLVLEPGEKVKAEYSNRIICAETA